MRLHLVVAATVMAVSLAAHADTITENFTVSGQAAYNSTRDYGVTSTSFSDFDTSLGTLNSITITLSGSATLTYTGTGPESASFSFLAPFSKPNVDLGGDVTGTSGSISSGSSTFNISASLIDDTDQSAFTYFEGTGTQALISQFFTTGTLVVNDDTSGTITYDYTPAAATPEPSSFALLGSGLLGVAGLVRRRRFPFIAQR